MKIHESMKTMLLSTTIAFASSALATPVLAVSEKELNDNTSIAQVLTSDGTPIQVSAVMGFADNPQQSDVDFYQFTAKAGDVLTVDIDNAYKQGAPIDTIIAIFGPAPDYINLRMNDDAPVDPGSNASLDSRIEDFVAPVDGVYTLGVATYPRYFYDGGRVSSAPMYAIGSYELAVSGVSASGSKKINIEVKPGNNGLAPLNPRSKGKIPVAILGSRDFSAINVDTTTLTFGSTGNEQSLSKCAKSGEDVNDDGYLDLVCHFDNQKAAFKQGDIEGILKGQMKSSVRSAGNFEGRALLKVLPSKKN